MKSTNDKNRNSWGAKETGNMGAPTGSESINLQNKKSLGGGEEEEDKVNDRQLVNFAIFIATLLWLLKGLALLVDYLTGTGCEDLVAAILVHMVLLLWGITLPVKKLPWLLTLFICFAPITFILYLLMILEVAKNGFGNSTDLHGSNFRTTRAILSVTALLLGYSNLIGMRQLLHMQYKHEITKHRLARKLSVKLFMACSAMLILATRMISSI